MSDSNSSSGIPNLSKANTHIDPDAYLADLPTTAHEHAERAGAFEPSAIHVEGYEIIEILGRGGMGIVYKARDLRLNRLVALKMILSGKHATADQLARFRQEAQTAASLQHPNIVQVYEVGQYDGHPYITLEYIDGTTLARFADGNPQPPRLAAELMEVLAGAMDYAHQQGIVHRDLKLGNVLLAASPSSTPSSWSSRSSGSDEITDVFPANGETNPDKNVGDAKSSTWKDKLKTVASREPETGSQSRWQSTSGRHEVSSGLLPKIADFGLAKQLDGDTDHTASGEVLGTVPYMAPEQAAGRAHEIGPAVDIYSLGAMLYCLLTGRPPFQGATPLDTLVMVKDADPVAPTQLQPRLSRDLETICLKCLEKSPSRRYSTAGELADELRRYLNDEPIWARPVTRIERMWRFCRRNPSLAAMSAALMIAVMTGLVLVTWKWREAASAREVERGLRVDAQDSRDTAESAQANEAQQRKRAETAQRVTQKLLTQNQRQLARMLVARGSSEVERGDLLSSLPWFTEALKIEQDDPDRAGQHRFRIASMLSQSPKLMQVWENNSEVRCMDVSPSGRHVAAGCDDGSVRVWNVESGELLMSSTKQRKRIWSVAFNHDGTLLLSASSDGTATVWGAVTGELVGKVRKHPNGLRHAVFSPDGNLVATACRDGRVYLWDTQSGARKRVLQKHEDNINCVQFSPDGRRLVTASEDATAQVWDVETGELCYKPIVHDKAVNWIAFDPKGERLVTASHDGSAQIWDAQTGERLGPPLRHLDRVLFAAFSPDGSIVATTSYDMTARIWDVENATQIATPLRHDNSIRRVSFSADGRHVVTASVDHTARVWDVKTGEPVTPALRHSFLLNDADFSALGNLVVTASADHTVRLWDIDSCCQQQLLMRHEGPVKTAELSRDGLRLVTASTDHSARIWDARTGHLIATLQHDDDVILAVFDSSGHLVLTGSRDGTARIWDVETGDLVAPPLQHEERVTSVAFSPDSRLVVTSSADFSARVWDAKTGEPVTPALRHRGGVTQAAFSADGKSVVTSGSDGTVRIWNASSGEEMMTLARHHAPVEAAAFSPSGKLVMSVSSDHSAILWDVSTAEQVGPRLTHAGGVQNFCFSPEGKLVVTGARDGTARVWDVATGKPRTAPLRHGRGLIRTHFSPDGELVATGGGDMAAYIWNATTGERLSAPFSHGSWVSHVRFSHDGRLLVTASEDGTARIHSIPQSDSRPVEDLVLIAELLSGHRADIDNGLVPLDPSELIEILVELREKYPEEFGVAKRSHSTHSGAFSDKQ